MTARAISYGILATFGLILAVLTIGLAGASLDWGPVTLTFLGAAAGLLIGCAATLAILYAEDESE